MVNILRICCQQKILNICLPHSRSLSTQILKNGALGCNNLSKIINKNTSNVSFIRMVRTFSKDKKNEDKIKEDDEKKEDEEKKEDKKDDNIDEEKKKIIQEKIRESSKKILIGYLLFSPLLLYALYSLMSKDVQKTNVPTFEDFLEKYLPTGEVKNVAIYKNFSTILVTLHNGAIIDGKSFPNNSLLFKLDKSQNDSTEIKNRIRSKERSLDVPDSECIPVEVANDFQLYIASLLIMLLIFSLPTIIFFKTRKSFSKIFPPGGKSKSS